MSSCMLTHAHLLQYVIVSSFATLHPLLVDHDITRSSRVRRFVRTCLSSCWKMLIQSPPLTLNTDGVGDAFDDVTQELQHSEAQDDDVTTVVSYYVYPTLKQGGKTLQKGLVVTKEKSDVIGALI